MAKVKKDWAFKKAEQFVNKSAGIFETDEDIQHDICRIAALLRRTFEKGYQIGVGMGDSIR
jgi:hypothetical protein